MSDHCHGGGCGCEAPVRLEQEEHGGGWLDHWPLAVCALLTLVLVLWEEGFDRTIAPWPRFLLYLAAYALTAGGVVREAWRRVVRFDLFNEFSLMTVATVGAFILGEYAEGVTVMLFYCIGELFQEAALNRARRSIAALVDVRPRLATVVEGGRAAVVPAGEVAIGSRIRVNPGERVPLDGRLLAERAEFNAAALTGESRPVAVSAGDTVLAGMVNGANAVELEVSSRFEDTMLSRILKLVEEASERKSRLQHFIGRFARVYTPIVTALAAALVILPFFFVAEYEFGDWFYRGLVFLVLSCPCALVISIPLGYFGGIGLASRNGILFKGSNYLDMLTKVDTVVLDKTGTLTKGNFKVIEVDHADHVSREELLAAAVAVERRSNHPVARAIREFAPEADAGIAEVSVTEVPGRGLKGVADGREVLAGSTRFLQEAGIAFPEKLAELPQTVVAVAVGGAYAGAFIIADELKPDAVAAIAALRNLGLRTVILSGDRTPLVRAVGRELGVDEAVGELLPDRKLEEVKKLQLQGRRVAFTGDGINDSPALALAEVGIAMGGLGSDAAIEVADVVIQDDRPSKIAAAIQAGRLTRRIVWENIVLAVAVKVLVLLAGSFGMANLWEAVFADVGVAVLAILNAMRLQQMRLDEVSRR